MFSSFHTRLTDEQLVARSRGGDSRATDVILHRYTALIHRVCSGYHIPHYAYDDMVQEARLGLLNAIARYDAASDAKFSTYAFLCVKSPLNHAWTAASRKHRGGGLEESSLDAALPILDENEAWRLYSLLADPSPGPERVVVKRDQCGRMIAAITEAVKHRHAAVLLERLPLGETLADVGRDLGVTRQLLEQIVRRMRRASESEVLTDVAA